MFMQLDQFESNPKNKYLRISQRKIAAVSDLIQ